MDTITAIKERRSVRKYKDQLVDRKLMEDIMDVTRYAPSWINYQVARWTLIDDPAVIAKLSTDGVREFSYNMSTLQNAKGVAILSFVKGKSGNMDNYDMESHNVEKWEVFDSGIACQTFCLAAHARGVATCIFGVIEETEIAKIIGLPADETVAALIVYGYADVTPPAPARKEISETVRFI